MAHKETIQGKAKRALKEAVRDLVKERRLTNDKVVVWKNGRVVHIAASKA
jgi:hypothetical protein